MARGLAVPVRISKTGGTVIAESDEQADKVIRLALGNNDNDNAFQQRIGLGRDFVFDISSPDFRAKILTRLFQVFAEFERADLFKLDRESISWSNGEDSGTQVLEFKYFNLESDEVATFARVFAPTPGG